MDKDETEETGQKSYIYVPGRARLNIRNVQDDPPITLYEKHRAVLRRDDVKEQVTKRIYDLDDRQLPCPSSRTWEPFCLPKLGA